MTQNELVMDLTSFCRELPKVELHAHLGGSLSQSTMLQLKRLYADSGIPDKTNAFFDEFQIAAGDTRSLSDCFQVFSIAHSLTSMPQALALATSLTLEEFQNDGCVYIELRSTPRETPYMSKKEYIDTIVQAIRRSSINLTIISKLIISIDRRSTSQSAEETTDLAIEFYQNYPEVVVGIELSGDPTAGQFKDFVPALTRAREAGMKITLHCGEICNPAEILEMLAWKPDRIGHGTMIHPRLGGTTETWEALCQLKIPVEICLTSNVNTKLIANYEAHQFKECCEAMVPVIICTDDKGVFATSLSQEYQICAETFGLDQSQVARLALDASQHIFDDDARKLVTDKILNFIECKEL
ncbi:adenosine deaminase-like protein [Leguminivora glycinivorella]|uniref:adenosine deaminase-like protein n=1 Tax=Leguminivora glycinivorella TaxID=1035111 RepID=UPI00200BD0CC|nr:adenosine deaminase-like protein [Leguminivora glycinivorella]